MNENRRSDEPKQGKEHQKTRYFTGKPGYCTL